MTTTAFPNPSAVAVRTVTAPRPRLVLDVWMRRADAMLDGLCTECLAFPCGCDR